MSFTWQYDDHNEFWKLTETLQSFLYKVNDKYGCTYVVK
jgi:hypothetical protein